MHSQWSYGIYLERDADTGPLLSGASLTLCVASSIYRPRCRIYGVIGGDFRGFCVCKRIYSDAFFNGIWR